MADRIVGGIRHVPGGIAPLPPESANPVFSAGQRVAFLAGASLASTKPELEVLTEFEAALPVWREMICCGGAILSGYQHPDWMSHWWTHIGARSAVDAYITVLRDRQGKPVLLLPLVRARFGLIRVGMFMGGKHANFNLPVWRDDLLGDPAEQLDLLVKGLGKQAPVVDLLVLLNQPGSWRGHANPMLRLSHRLSSSSGYSGALGDDYETLLKKRLGRGSRKKLRQKERRLSAFGPIRYWQARTREEIARVLETFFAQKADRMNQLGLANGFAAPGVKEFISAAAHDRKSTSEAPVIELYAMSVGDEIVATFAGITADGRFCGMFNSMADNPYREHSPGELLLSNVIRLCCERGLHRFDLGVGDAAYKKVFCNEVEMLYDSVIPITASGRLAAPWWRMALSAKRRLKKSRAVTQLRRIAGRFLAHAGG